MLFIAHGFEEIEKDTIIRKDLQTCCKQNFRIILLNIVSFDWKIHSLDIKSAFLQGQPINRNVFLKPPPEVDTINLWKLLETLYSLCDTPRAWYLKVRGTGKSRS